MEGSEDFTFYLVQVVKLKYLQDWICGEMWTNKSLRLQESLKSPLVDVGSDSRFLG